MRPSTLAALALAAALAWAGGGEAQAEPHAEPGSELTVATMWEVLPLSMEARRSRFFNESEILDTLVKLDHEMRLVPGLATAWEREGPTTWRFTLRPGVTFHDGTPFDAAAAKLSLERVLALLPYARSLLPLAEIRAEGDDALVIETEAPFSALPNQLTDAFTGIYAAGSFDAEGRFVQPIGTGPYRFVDYQPQSHTRVEAFADYWGEAPAIETVTFRYVPDHNTRALALEAGEVDFADNLPPAELRRLQQQARLTTHEAPTAGLYYLVLNTAAPSPLADARVRRALDRVIDREEIVEFALEGAGLPARTFFSEAFDAFPKEEAVALDRDAASALLREAGYEHDGRAWRREGEPLRLALHSYSTRTEMAVLLEAVSAELRAFGVETTLALHTWPGMLEIAQGGGYDAYLVFWTPEMIGHPDLHLTPHLHSAHNLDHNGYANAELDALLERGRELDEGAERGAVYREALALIRADAPLLPLVHRAALAAHDPRLEGYRVHPSGFFYDFKSVRWRE